MHNTIDQTRAGRPQWVVPVLPSAYGRQRRYLTYKRRWAARTAALPLSGARDGVLDDSLATKAPSSSFMARAASSCHAEAKTSPPSCTSQASTTSPLASPNRKGKACSCPPLSSPRCFAASHISASYSSLALPRGCHRDGCAGSVLPGDGFVAGGPGSGAHDHLQPPSAGTPLAARRRQMPPLRRRGTSAL